LEVFIKCITDLTPPALSTLAYLNPGLTTLRLDFCGRIDDSVMDTWSTAFPALKRLDLHAPFLIRVPAWKKFFESHPHLEAFLITQSPRFDIECLESLVTNCPDLKELRLREIGKMEDKFADHLAALEGKLTVLDLSEPGKSMSEDVLIDLVAVVGPTLRHLDLSKHDKITDAFLDEGLKPHTRVLTSLTLNHVPDLTDEGVADFFTTWASPAAQGESQQDPNPALTAVDLSRNCNLSSTALSTLLVHSGGRLQHLNINGWKAASRESLEQIARFAWDLRTLDVGFCHKVDDFVLKEILDKCERIKEIKCFGCNRVTGSCPRKVSVLRR
jgi:DNA repair protein RAD7